MMKKLTGREPAQGSGIEPIEVSAPPAEDDDEAWASSTRRSAKARAWTSGIKNLVELKGAQMIGCEYCVDLGSQICRNSGFSDQSS